MEIWKFNSGLFERLLLHCSMWLEVHVTLVQLSPAVIPKRSTKNGRLSYKSVGFSS